MAQAPVRVVVTGAAGQIGYSLLPFLASGSVFGQDRVIDLRLLEIPQAVSALEGVKMELRDCAYPCLGEVLCTSDANEAFRNADVGILVGGFPRRKGMLRKDLIAKNTGIFKAMGRAIDNTASPNIKIVVVANPANTNCLTALRQCSRVPHRNFTALTRLDRNRACSALAAKIGAGVSKVKNVIIWGNHSATQYPDASSDGFLAGADGAKTPLDAAVNDAAWLQTDFIKTVQQRGKAVIEARGKSSAMSAANAVADHLRTWLVTGTAPGEHVPMGVLSTGEYGIEAGIVFSFPCECRDGEYNVVPGLQLSEFARSKLQATMAELIDERAAADEVLQAGASESKI